MSPSPPWRQNKKALYRRLRGTLLGGASWRNRLQDDTVASYFAMLKAFQGSKTAQSPSQQGLGLPKSIFKTAILRKLGIGSKVQIDPSFSPRKFFKKMAHPNGA